MRRHLLLMLLLTLPAAAQPNPHAGMAMSPSPAAGPSMMEAMDSMNQAMRSAPMTGNPDHDFAAMMIPHHRGAIDMAKYELQHGRDPELRKLAQAVIAAQNKEIGQMQRWLDTHATK